MKKTKKISYIPWLGTPKNDLVFTLNKSSWEYELKKILNKKGVDIHTNDVLKIKDADACIIFDNMFYKNIDYIVEMYKYKKLEHSVYIDYEPPTGHCKNHSAEGIKRLSKIFKCVITYDDDLVDGRRILKGNIGNFYSKELKYNNDFEKRKLITMITNNTGNEQIIGILNYYNASSYFNNRNTKMHKKELYSKRKEIATYLLENHTSDFDLYGELWPEMFKPVKKGYIERNKKLKTMSKYKFIVSFDSYSNQNGYISEKLFDAFNAKVVPIYLGAKNINKYVPESCYIDFRNFANYSELLIFLKNMTKEVYENYIKSIEEYLKSDTYKKLFSSSASAEIISNAVFNEIDDYSYEEALKNINYYLKKRNKVKNNRKINFYTTRYDNNGDSVSIIFCVNYFGYDAKGKYVVKANGAEVPQKNIKIDVNKYEDLVEYEFECDFDNIDKFLHITVDYVTANKTYNLFLNDFGTDFSKSIGLYTSYNKKKILYTNKNRLNIFQKGIILAIKNPKKLVRLFDEKIIYRARLLFRKISRIYNGFFRGAIFLKNNSIKGKSFDKQILTIVIRIINLPFVLIKDVINIFVFK